ncbi:LacI family DNA-binding transcriptional regulator [Phytoactinopolyspora mesophila]|uniref:LacI family DNA-binding transcriptional regulator n=1 Tax=Phytoactinopolyspora mesophila TaxID=2650750 RepID=A0A7K3MB47_9ACTN|nr:LacI family DNA-binding transcriptional regulator [Phytoactinopolyspora mesophila]NDL60539.1 LacI family DNA-binding transcriptional regulator [Phytoactinopolyspora mesophila]
MQSTGRVTIGDVAKTAKVSVATVSKVINGRYGVAPETEVRVQEVIEQLGYESSLVARSLRSRRTNVVGILVAEFEPFSTELLKGISEAVHGTDYELMAYTGGLGRHERVGWEKRYLARLAGTLIDGAVLVTPTVSLEHESIPVVAVDPHTGPSGAPTIDSDSFAGARLAAEHLISLGHTRIGFLGGRVDLESARLREQGYRSALKDAGIEVDPALMRIGGYRPDLADIPAHELLSMSDRPTAIFAANDLSAIRTMEIARELGLRVPEDISVIGFDNVPESAMSDPPLTTVAQPIHEMGAQALGMVIDLINGVSREPHVRLPTNLVTRASCRPL